MPCGLDACNVSIGISTSCAIMLRWINVSCLWASAARERALIRSHASSQTLRACTLCIELSKQIHAFAPSSDMVISDAHSGATMCSLMCWIVHIVLQFVMLSSVIFTPEIVKLGHSLCSCVVAESNTADSTFGDLTGSQSRRKSGDELRDFSSVFDADRMVKPAPFLPSCTEIELLSVLAFCIVRSRLLSFRNGQREIPWARHIFFREVRHIPIFAATTFSGMWKNSESSSSVMADDEGGIVVAREEARESGRVRCLQGLRMSRVVSEVLSRWQRR
mmetsp:Transcript_51667/g.75554  ORF Transcript_51667/g.75554 Transcript_51667/m.75554 type:complete len:276 (+) Transcript_51667:513-1340(+)